MAKAAQKVTVVVTAPPPDLGPCVLTPHQKQLWQDTMSLMAWTCPGMRHIFYKLLSNNKGEYVAIFTRGVPIAATDGKNILLNPDTFFKFTLMECVFIIVHEVMHNVYCDIALMHSCKARENVPMPDGSTLPYEHRTMNKSMDYRINALLVESRIGTMPKVGLIDKSIAVGNDSVYDVYKKVYEGDPPDPNGGFDIILEPGASTGQDPQQAINQHNPQQWAVEIHAAKTLESKRTQGKMPAALARMFDAILEPKVPWAEHIRTIINRRLGGGGSNWRRPDRRFIMQDLHMPSRSGFGARHVVIWGDTSGSIGKEEMTAYLGEFAGIIEDVKPERLTVLWCDAAIHQVDELSEGSDLEHIRYKGLNGGGGGTDMHPCLEWIEANCSEPPDAFIGFTDGFVDFPPSAPSYPCIWASVAKKPEQYPFGEVVMIKDGD